MGGGRVSGTEMFGGTAEVWWIVKVERITVKLNQWVGAEKSTVDYGGAFCLRYGVLYRSRILSALLTVPQTVVQAMAAISGLAPIFALGARESLVFVCVL
jgi:hypothetical protein